MRTSDDLFREILLRLRAVELELTQMRSGEQPRDILVMTDGVTAPSATVGRVKLFTPSSDNDLKVIFGDGVTKTIVTDS